jgi:uncharacterized protein (TIGR03083 family)
VTAGGSGSVTLPPGLRDRVLAASHEVRAGGRSVPEVASISAIEVFSRAVAAFDEVLGQLDADDWRRPVLRDLTVQELVGHLVGVERDVLAALNGDRAVADVDHVAATQEAARDEAAQPPAATRRRWLEAAEATRALVGERDLDTEVAVHTLRPSIASLLLVRAFELWTHENDIRAVSGLPPSVPDPASLATMTNLAARALPVGADRIGLREPTRVRLVLTGASGGTWDVTLGDEQPDGRSVRIIADTVDFCRLAANRVRPAELDLHVTGDPDRIAAVLASVAALALD